MNYIPGYSLGRWEGGEEKGKEDKEEKKTMTRTPISPPPHFVRARRAIFYQERAIQQLEFAARRVRILRGKCKKGANREKRRKQNENDKIRKKNQRYTCVYQLCYHTNNTDLGIGDLGIFGYWKIEGNGFAFRTRKTKKMAKTKVEFDLNRIGNESKYEPQKRKKGEGIDFATSLRFLFFCLD